MILLEHLTRNGYVYTERICIHGTDMYTRNGYVYTERICIHGTDMYNTERILVSRNDKFINTERICIVLINIRIRPK